MDNSDKVPSIISYSPASEAKEEQWGSDLSSDAVAMVHTKLELDEQDDKSDELLLLIHALDGMKNLHFDNVREARGLPDFTWKAPEMIVKDYFEFIVKCVDQQLEYMGPEMRNSIPVDIVLTTPVVSTSFTFIENTQ
jgi:hypothetical protein